MHTTSRFIGHLRMRKLVAVVLAAALLLVTAPVAAANGNNPAPAAFDDEPAPFCDSFLADIGEPCDVSAREGKFEPECNLIDNGPETECVVWDCPYALSQGRINLGTTGRTYNSAVFLEVGDSFIWTDWCNLTSLTVEQADVAPNPQPSVTLVPGATCTTTAGVVQCSLPAIAAPAPIPTFTG